MTGTHIRGTSDLPARTRVVTRAEIESGGFTTVERLLEALPENFAGVHPAASNGATNFSRFAGGGFQEHATAVDLRGLGPDSTLVLLNGKRRAPGGFDGRFVDVSTIPLAAIERVDIVTGGASALYGSDAVAGVVNYVMRRDFEGMQTQASYGGPTQYGGGERLVASHVIGQNFARGNVVAGIEYRSDSPSNYLDIGLFPADQLPSGRTFRYMPFQTDLERASGFAFGTLDLTDGIGLYADILYSRKDSEYEQRSMILGAAQESFSRSTVSADEYSGSLGAKLDLPGGWSLDASGQAARSKTPMTLASVDASSTSNVDGVQTSRRHSDLYSGSLVADGPLFFVGAIVPRAAFGVEMRKDEFTNEIDTVVTFTPPGTTFMTQNLRHFDRTIRSAFGELRVPLMEEIAGTRKLEATVGARYDDYSDVGDTFNWTGGLIWQPLAEIKLRANYATAFHAPGLSDTAGSGTAELRAISDPTEGPGGVSPVLFLGGVAPVEPEEAETWSAGLDYRPSFAAWARLAAYFISIQYENRIAPPMTAAERLVALQREARFPTLISRTPTLSDVQNFLDQLTFPTVTNTQGLPAGSPWNQATGAAGLLAAIPDLILIDRRTANLAIDRYRGLDLSLDTQFETAVGRFTFGLNGTYMLDRDTRFAASTELFSGMNEVGRPVDLRLRGSAGWTGRLWSAFLYLNYADSYPNNFSTPASSVEAWETIDASLRFNGSAMSGSAWLQDLSATLSVSNLLDRDVPAIRSALGQALLAYDPANANPLGRYVTLNLTKEWDREL